jgi:hypothetical protein
MTVSGSIRRLFKKETGTMHGTSMYKVLRLSSRLASSAPSPSTSCSLRRPYLRRPRHRKVPVYLHQRRMREGSRQVRATRRPCSPATRQLPVSRDKLTIDGGQLFRHSTKSCAWRIPATGGPSRDRLGSHRATLRDMRRT